MRRARIATVFYDLGIGGDENRVLSFAQHLDRDRFEHVVVTLVDRGADAERRTGPMGDRYREAGVVCLGLDEPRPETLPALPRGLSALRFAGRTLRMAARLA